MLLLLVAAGCREAGPPPPGPPLAVTLATHATPYSGLIALAAENGYFERAGLNVTITLHPSGRDALGAMMRGEAHFATVADIAFAGAIDEDPSLRVIAAIGASSGSEVVARKDRGIHQPADLKGKRVAYSPGTSSDYFLHSFLLANHISREEITPVAVPPARQVEAVVTGEVDAVSAFDIYTSVARKELAGNAVAWNIQNTIDYQWLLATRQDATPPGASRRLLDALLLAEDFAMNHAEETVSIVARKWGIDPQFIRYSSARTRLFVSFNQSVITALQTYVKWHMDNEGRAGDPPDVLAHIDTRPLDEVNPKLVTIFR